MIMNLWDLVRGLGYVTQIKQEFMYAHDGAKAQRFKQLHIQRQGQKRL